MPFKHAVEDRSISFELLGTPADPRNRCSGLLCRSKQSDVGGRARRGPHHKRTHAAQSSVPPTCGPAGGSIADNVPARGGRRGQHSRSPHPVFEVSSNFSGPSLWLPKPLLLSLPSVNCRHCLLHRPFGVTKMRQPPAWVLLGTAACSLKLACASSLPRGVNPTCMSPLSPSLLEPALDSAGR